jgi:RNase P subunit RPR2
MSILIAMCPRCRSRVNTGISADLETMQQLGPKLQVLILCDDCNEYQRMLVKDLHLSTVERAA